MATASHTQRRRTPRKASDRSVVRIEVRDGMGRSRYVTADVIDRSDHGIGVALVSELKPGNVVVVRGRLGQNGEVDEVRCSVSWCIEGDQNGFRAGLEFVDRRGDAAAGGEEQPAESPEDVNADTDYYEIMELSPNAEIDTVERVYRILAQRYHPDNRQTGSQETFVRLCEAYEVLHDPKKRARYDAAYAEAKRLRWKIFDQSALGSGTEGEKRKRNGILGLLYAKMLHNPDRASVNLREMEELLGCPREHLEAALWYLRGKGYIQRGDNAKYEITVQGFEQAESQAPVSAPDRPQITAPDREN